jgi:hypothetical protein
MIKLAKMNINIEKHTMQIREAKSSRKTFRGLLNKTKSILQNLNNQIYFKIDYLVNSK